MYGTGISREGSILDVAVDLGIVKKAGAWYTYEGEQLGQGRENAKQFLRDSAELVVEIDNRIRQEFAATTIAADVPLGSGENDDVPISLED
jgi:recombination protein RecA